MKKTRRKTMLFPVMFCALYVTTYAQQNTVASGGDATGAGGSASYSIGQIDYVTSSGSGGTASQGVQQPYEIYTTGVSSVSSKISLQVFPNPVADLLTLTVSDPNLTGLSYKVLSVEGRLITENKISSAEERIDFQQTTNGVYFLKVVNSHNKEVQSFKIIKTK